MNEAALGRRPRAGLCQMLRPWAAASSLLLAVFLRPNSARAESFVPSCAWVEIVEVFAGTEDCPWAHYVVLKTELSGGGGTLLELDHCGDYRATIATYPTPPMSPGTTFLLARPEAVQLFGIRPDHLIGTSGAPIDGLVPAPDGHLSSPCHPAEELVYGAYPGATAPALVPGKALRFNGSSWELVDPAPMNSSGDVGVPGTCPADAIARDAGAAGSPSTEEDAGYPECFGGAGGNGGWTATGGAGGSRTAAGGTGVAGSEPVEADAGIAASGGLTITDAGPSAAANAPGGGCACRATRTKSQGSAAAVAALAAVAVFRRRRSVPVKYPTGE